MPPWKWRWPRRCARSASGSVNPSTATADRSAAASWRWPKSEPIVAAAIVITLAITGYTTQRLRETGELRAVREIARELNLRARPGEPVLALQPSEMPLAFYCPRVDALHPDINRTRLFVVANRDYGQTEFFVTDDDGYSHCFGVATRKNG